MTYLQEIEIFIKDMTVNQSMFNGETIQTVHIPSLLHKVTELIEKEQSGQPVISDEEKIELLEWVATMGYEYSIGGDFWFKGGEMPSQHITTKQVTELFNNRKP